MNTTIDNPYENIQDIQERRKKFLDDMCGFYNSSNRAVLGKMCVYEPTANSPGCAIGRWLPFDVSRKEAMNGNRVDEVIDVLPRWMVGMGVNFLLACQSLHDGGYYWNENGLSIQGEYYRRQILVEYFD